jgi:AcrR family transcriptional regulator
VVLDDRAPLESFTRWAEAGKAGGGAVWMQISHPGPEQLASVAVAYVQFALEQPALFRMMFGEPCDRDNDERVAATAAVSLYLREIVARCFPQADAEALAPAIWALVHGLAFLHLDGKLDASTPSAVADRVTAAIHGLLSTTAGD